MGAFSADDLILVTGARSGIGRAVAEALMDEGARVVGIGRDAVGLAAMAAAHPAFAFETADLSNNLDICDDLVARIVARHGRLSGFVHAAGVKTPEPLAVLSAARLQADMNVNALAAALLSKAVAAKKHRQDKLSLLYISSVAAVSGNPGAVSYAMGKAALNALTVTLARELGGKGVRVNAIMPGSCDTPMLNEFAATMPGDHLADIAARNIHGTLMPPAAVADLALFLLSEKGRWVQGQCIALDGGESLPR